MPKKLSDKMEDANLKNKEYLKERVSTIFKGLDNKDDPNSTTKSAEHSYLDFSKRPNLKASDHDTTNSSTLETATLDRNHTNPIYDDYGNEVPTKGRGNFVFPTLEELTKNISRLNSSLQSRKKGLNGNYNIHKIKSKNELNYIPLEIEMIEAAIAAFKHKIIAISKRAIIIKETKYGFELSWNANDLRMFVAALEFKEPFDPEDPKYSYVWVGGGFLAYGFKTWDEVIKKTKDMMVSGKTASVLIREDLLNCDVRKLRIIATNHGEGRDLTLAEYKKFLTWFSKDKIRIMVKNVNVYDQEDFAEEMKKLAKAGKNPTAIQIMRSKSLPLPHKSSAVIAYPVFSENVKGKEWANPKNKKYRVSFMYV